MPNVYPVCKRCFYLLSKYVWAERVMMLFYWSQRETMAKGCNWPPADRHTPNMHAWTHAANPHTLFLFFLEKTLFNQIWNYLGMTKVIMQRKSLNLTCEKQALMQLQQIRSRTWPSLCSNMSKSIWSCLSKTVLWLVNMYFEITIGTFILVFNGRVSNRVSHLRRNLKTINAYWAEMQSCAISESATWVMGLSRGETHS